MTDYVLRAALTTDAGQVGQILSDFVDATPWMPRLHTRAEDLSFAGDMIDRDWVTVAETATGIAGFVARNGEEIHALYVDATARGAGCGSALLRRMKGQAASLTLWTAQINSRARAFYGRHGFVEVERTDGSGSDERLPDVRLSWRRGT